MKKKNIITAVVGAIAAVAAAVFFIKRRKPDADAPPKNAPQLNLQNPGEQSEFTPAPSGEPDLG